MRRYTAGLPIPTFFELEVGFAGCSYLFADEGEQFIEVGRCRLTVSNPEMKARLVSAIETDMW
jgi:hypothetical protein